MGRRASLLTVLIIMAIGVPGLVNAAGSLEYSGITVCLNPPSRPTFLFGTGAVELVVHNGGKEPANLFNLENFKIDRPKPCDAERNPGGVLDLWTTVEPGATWYGQFLIGQIAGTGDPTTIGVHKVSIGIWIDNNGDFKSDWAGSVETEFEITSPPYELVRIADEFSSSVELCWTDGHRTKGRTIQISTLLDNRKRELEGTLPDKKTVGPGRANRQGTISRPTHSTSESIEVLQMDETYNRLLRGRDLMLSGEQRSRRSLIEMAHRLVNLKGWYSTSRYEERWGKGLEQRFTKHGDLSARTLMACNILIKKGKLEALRYLEAIENEGLPCVEALFLADIRLVIQNAPDGITYEQVINDRRETE